MKKSKKMEEQFKDELLDVLAQHEDVPNDAGAWQKVKIKADEDAEVIKLDVNEGIEGLLIDTFKSVKYNAGVYKIKVKDDPKTKIILGTTMLDKMMMDIKVGNKVKIVRLNSITNKKGQAVKMYDVFTMPDEK